MTDGSILYIVTWGKLERFLIVSQTEKQLKVRREAGETEYRSNASEWSAQTNTLRLADALAKYSPTPREAWAAEVERQDRLLLSNEAEAARICLSRHRAQVKKVDAELLELADNTQL